MQSTGGEEEEEEGVDGVCDDLGKGREVKGREKLRGSGVFQFYMCSVACGDQSMHALMCVCVCIKRYIMMERYLSPEA